MNTVKSGLLGAGMLLMLSIPAHAIDTWSTTKGVLNMPLVQYGTKTYQNVTAVIGGVVSVGSSCTSTSTAADTLSTSNGQLTIPAVNVTKADNSSVTYCNAQVWLSSITSVGGVCADSSSCAQYFTPVSYASTMPRSYKPSLILSSSLTARSRYLVSDTSSDTTSANYLMIGNDYKTSANPSNSSGYIATSGKLPLSSTYKTYLNKLIQVVPVTETSGVGTVYDNTPTALVGYRLDSHLHPNESMDVDTTTGILKFARNIGVPPAGTAFSKTTAMTPIPTSDGFIAFSYNTSTKKLQAVKRYVRSVVQDVTVECLKAPCYNSTFTVATSFPQLNYYVKFSNGVYSLVSDLASATPLYFYGSSDGYAVTTMNPTGEPYTTNGAWAYPTNATGSTSGVTQPIVTATEVTSPPKPITKYLNQVYVGTTPAPGANESTKAAADAMLQTIKTEVESNATGLNGVSCLGNIPTGTLAADMPKAALRYSPSVYTAFRDALLSSVLVSDAASDGTPNQRNVPFVYFANEQDTNGCYHPFMVIITYGQPMGPHGLLDIPLPPLAGMQANSTRFTNLVGQTIRIPMRNYGNINTSNMSTINNINVPGFTANLCTDRFTECWVSTFTTACPNPATLPTTTSAATLTSTYSQCLTPDAYDWASSNDNGISYDGAQTFPIVNAALIPSSWKAELSTYGCHVGQGGGGPHCHADGYVADASNRLTLYSDKDYVGRNHPPLVAFGYDGIASFGRYRNDSYHVDNTMLGFNTALDEFSGHDHDGIGYHYHARVAQLPASPKIYTYTANGKTICSTNDPKCIVSSTSNYSGTTGKSTPTAVSTLVQGAWKANLQNIPCFRSDGYGFDGTKTVSTTTAGVTLCKVFIGQ